MEYWKIDVGLSAENKISLAVTSLKLEIVEKFSFVLNFHISHKIMLTFI